MSDHLACVGITCMLADTSIMAWMPAVLTLAGVGAMGGVMMVYFNRRERQLKALAAQIRNDVEEGRALRQQLDDVHAMASNMMVTAQRLSARLDERVAALDMASLRMNAARNALPRAAVAAPAGRSRSADRPHSDSPTARQNDLNLSPVLSSIATAMSPPMHSPGSTRATVEIKPPSDEFTRSVYQMADAGQPAVDIARALKEQVGKVELVLALRGCAA